MEKITTILLSWMISAILYAALGVGVASYFMPLSSIQIACWILGITVFSVLPGYFILLLVHHAKEEINPATYQTNKDAIEAILWISLAPFWFYIYAIRQYLKA